MPEGVAVVVGCGGIGGACADALGSDYTVLAVDRDAGAARKTSDSVRQIGGKCEVLVADAGEAAFGEAVARAALSLGSVACAVHAVAYEEHVAALDVPVESVWRSFAVGPVAAFGVFRELLRQGAAGPGASFVAIGSLHERYAFPRCLGYNAAHAALGQVVRTLAHEWAELRVRVNAVVPGWILTPGEEVLYDRETLVRAGSRLPFGDFGTPAQVAAAVRFLCSTEADYISGSFLTVDGALSAGLARLPIEERA